jgi:hypothetical protein
MSSIQGLSYSNDTFLDFSNIEALQVEIKAVPPLLTNTVKVQWQSLCSRAGEAGVTESRTVNTHY